MSARVVMALCWMWSLNDVLAWLRRVCGVWLALRGCRPEAAFWRGLLSFDVVILKTDHLHPEPFIDFFETLLQRRQLVTHKHSRDLLDIAH